MTNTVKIIVEVEAEPGQPLGELTDELCADIRRSWPSGHRRCGRAGRHPSLEPVMQTNEREYLTCKRCRRELRSWPLQRGGQCAPKDWVYCIAEPVVDVPK